MVPKTANVVCAFHECFSPLVVYWVLNIPQGLETQCISSPTMPRKWVVGVFLKWWLRGREVGDG